MHFRLGCEVMPRCKGTSRQHKRRCRKMAVKGTDYCRNHGGALIRKARQAGPSHQNWKTGRFSRYAHLLNMDAEADRDLLSSAPELAVMDKLVNYQLKNLISGLPVDMADLREMSEQAMSAEDPEARDQALSAVLGAIQSTTWSDQKALQVARMIDMRAKIAQNERKQIVLESRHVTALELEKAFLEVERVLNEYVDDPAKRIEFARPFRKLVGIQDSGEADVEEPVEEPLEFDTPS